MDRCEECGFDYSAVPGADIAPRLRNTPARYAEAVAGLAPDRHHRRPSPEVWSVVEYVCHARDVVLIQRDRAVLALVEDRPSFARMYRDERVELCRYGREPLERAITQLTVAGELCASVFEDLGPSALSRPLIYNYPAPAEFDLRWLGVHTVHEAEHHLLDVTRIINQLEG